jgi:Nif-specific regulatory protein
MGERGEDGVGAKGGWEGTLEEVLALSRTMAAEHRLEALFELITREGARLLGAERATVFLLDRERGELWSQATLDGEIIRMDARLGIAGACALAGQLINVEDAQHDSRFHDAVDRRTRFRTRTVLAVPLRTPAGEVIGAFQLLNKKPGIFTKADEQVAVTLADQAAVAVETATMVQTLHRQRRDVEAENIQLRRQVEEKFPTQRIIGQSPPMQAIVRLIDQLRDSPVDVLITGESGTGKELIAKALHSSSSRARRPLIAINCAALPESLIESELFGIEKGIATGVERRAGKFEDANGGTLFLDEIGDLHPGAQVKLLRVLQERVVQRIGGRVTIPVDVRVIAATNVNLEEAIKGGGFRADLYYRLKVVTIRVPALRERTEDIPALANYFLDETCRSLGKEPKKFSAGALRRLTRAAWPGNIRELEHEVTRLVVTVRKATIGEEDLSMAVAVQSPAAGGGLAAGRSLKQAVEELEKRLIGDALRQCEGNQVQTAKTLGLSRQGLIKKIKRYGRTSE